MRIVSRGDFAQDNSPEACRATTTRYPLYGYGGHYGAGAIIADEPRFKQAFPYQKDVLALPVTALDAAAKWYGEHFGMTEVERLDQPVPTVILERGGIRIGFDVNSGDPAQDGAAVLVSNIRGLKDDLQAKGAKIGDWRVDE